MRCALSLVALALGCGAQLGDPAPPQNAMPPPSGKGDGSGAGSGSGSSAAAPITATKYCDGLASLDCTEAFKCRADFPTDLGYAFADVYGTSLQSCNEMLVTDFQPQAIESEIALGRIAYDGAAAGACLQGLTYGDCNEYFRAGPHWGQPCYLMFAAKVATGGGCALDMSCTSGSCDLSTQTCK
jgi:hypothetical protein